MQLPCPLAPGSYDYEIWLVEGGLAAEVAPGRPEQILRAQIVVE